MIVNFRSFFLFLCVFFSSVSYSSTGYYIGLSGDIKRFSITPEMFDADVFSGFHQEFKKTRRSVTIVTGYMYSLPKIFSLAGQVYFGLNEKIMELHKNWIYKDQGKEYQMVSHFDLWNRFNFGAEILAGTKVSHFLLYGICGFQIQLMQSRGNFQALSNGEKDVSIIYFGKNAKNIRGIDWPKIQPLHKICPAAVLGLGGRFYLLEKIFVGVEGRYLIAKNRSLKSKYALFDPQSVFCSLPTTSAAGIKMNDKKDIKMKSKGLGISIVVGLRL